MSFGSDLDHDSFARAFADHDIRPLLGLTIPDSAATKIVADQVLMQNVYAEWKRKQPRTAALTAARSGAASAPVSPKLAPIGAAPRTGSRASSSSTGLGKASTAELRDLARGTGFWAAVLAAASLLAAWVSMSIGFFLAEDRMTPKGEFGFLGYGRASYEVAGDSLIWAGVFAVAALVFSGVAIRRGKDTGRRFPFWTGIVGAVAAAIVTVVIIFNSVRISTWI